MSFWNFIRDIFGGRNLEPKNEGSFYHRNSYDTDNFRNPIWQNDEDDDDADDFRHSRGNIHFRIFSDPLEIAQYFESQMDGILKNFMFGFGNKDQNTYMNPLPFAPSQEENLRDKMLKPSDSLSQTEPKLDADLDGKITVDNFSNVWDQYNKPKSSEVFVPRQHIIRKSVSKEYVHRSDGTIEQKQVVTDSEGNEETIISRQIGDKKYTITMKKDKHGVETKTENLVNIDESELREKKWKPSNNSGTSYFSLNYFPWEKFFKPDPKL